MKAWQEVRDLITKRNVEALADRVIGLSDDERAEVGRRMPDLLNEIRETATQKARKEMPGGDAAGADDWLVRANVRWSVRDAIERYAELLQIAGGGTTSGPAQAAAWLTRREFNPRGTWWRHLHELVRVLTARPADWQADVARRLCGRIRRAEDRVVPLALAMLRATGAEPPEHDPLVVAWLSADPVNDDPLADALLPRIFEAEGAGRALREERLTPSPSRRLALIGRWIADGRMSREEVLDGCVRRFLRGGDATDLRFFVRLHTLIDPTPQEAAKRTRDYLRLLASSPGKVAELALAQVRRTGFPDPADAAEAIDALTFRAEAKLVRAGLSLLDERVRRSPEHAADLVPALVTAFAHDSADVQEHAVRLAVKHAAAFAPAADPIAEAVPQLRPELGAQVAAVFGGDASPQVAPEPFVPSALPARSAPGPFPPPTVQMNDRYLHGWVQSEQWLAAFVEQAGRDRAALRQSLIPVFETSHPHLYGSERWLDTHYWIAALAKEVISPGTDPGVPDPEPVDPWEGSSFQVHVAALPDDEPAEDPDDTLEPGQASTDAGDGEEAEKEPARAFGDLPEPVREEIFRQIAEIGVSAERVAAMRDGLPGPPPDPDEPRFSVFIAYCGNSPLFGERQEPDPAVEFRRRHRLPQPRQVSPPHMFLLHRLCEIYVALRQDALPPVLLATPTLLTGHLDPDVLVDRLETCANAGVEPLPADFQQALLRLPRGTHPEAAERASRIGSRAAASAAAWLAGGGMADPETGVKWAYIEGATEYLFEEREPEYGEQIRLRPVLRAEPTGHDLIDELLREPPAYRLDDHGYVMYWWPAILPSHREVIAVNYLPHLLYTWHHPGVYPAYLAALADADGPVVDATALILAYFLADRPTDGVPLLLRMAARGDLPVAALGRQLAFLVRRTWIKIRPVLASLTEAAHAGAHEHVWEVLRTMLPVLLPGEGERPNTTHTEAVAFAADVATWVQARGEIPAVTAFASSGRRSQFVRECVRLRDQLR
ncbi:DUF6493 family protein [Thermopolyspora sp. NPDC052614]|uniref:DUF6493 family protein n=1 Tax=Thermopolyspora sp. NPDC052614 TaxID=3155682 RepID=UPI00342EB0FE